MLMAFEPGHKLATGRPPGSPNKRTKEIEEIVETLGCNPFEVLMRFAMGDWKGLGYESGTKVKAVTEDGEAILEDTISPELRASSAKDACKYLYSQKKAVEHSGEVKGIEIVVTEYKKQLNV
jgi:hypothetical protein